VTKIGSPAANRANRRVEAWNFGHEVLPFTLTVVAAKAGTQGHSSKQLPWTPAFAVVMNGDS